MRKSVVSAVVVSLALVLAFTASAQAVSIGINLAVNGNADSQVSSSLSDGYVAQTNWNNNDPWNGGFLASPVDSTGAAVTSGLSVGLDLAWGGGWSYYFEYGRVCSATTNSLGRTGWNAQYGPIITLANIPYTNYTVATLVNNGYGIDELSWQVETGQTTASYRTPSYQNGGGSMCAIQIINTGGGPATPVLLTSPSAVHLGRIIKGAASPSQNIDVNEAGGAATTYPVSAVSNSDFTVADAGTTVGILANGHNTHAVTADTSTVGSKSASVTVAGTAVAMDATVLEHANGTFANTTGVLSSGDKVLTLNFGTVAVGAGGGNIDSFFDIYANVVLAGPTANLDLTGIVGDLSKLTGASTFAGLAAGNTQGYAYHLSTSAAGVLSASYTFSLADEAGIAGGTTDTLTLNVSASVVHPGDANADGQVSLLDYNVIKVNFGNVYGDGTHWTDGDVNADGQVGLLDFNIVKAHFGHTAGDVGVTAVPEPATLSLLALAGLAALRRKR